MKRDVGPHWSGWKWKRGEPRPRRRVSHAGGESPRAKYPLAIWVTAGACSREGSSRSASWKGRRARGAKGSVRPRFPLPAGAALPLASTDPAPGRRSGRAPRARVPASARAKRIHPGNASTLPNSSPFPPVAMATRDLTEFLGDLPAFSAETELINVVFLMPSLSAGAWSHLGLGPGPVPLPMQAGSCPWAAGFVRCLAATSGLARAHHRGV